MAARLSPFERLVRHGLDERVATHIWPRATGVGSTWDIDYVIGDYIVSLRGHPRADAFDIDISHPETQRPRDVIWLTDERDAVDQYLSIIWTLGAPTKKVRNRGFTRVNEFAGVLEMPKAMLLDRLARHSREMRATEVSAEERQFILVAFFDTNPQALVGVPRFRGGDNTITAEYGNVTVLEFEL